MSDAETAEALAMCDAQFHPHALAALKHHSEKTGQDWHLTAVQKCEQKENGVLLGLVLCSGDLCSMLDFIVKDDFTVEPQVNKFGF